MEKKSMIGLKDEPGASWGLMKRIKYYANA